MNYYFDLVAINGGKVAVMSTLLHNCEQESVLKFWCHNVCDPEIVHCLRERARVNHNPPLTRLQRLVRRKNRGCRVRRG